MKNAEGDRFYQVSHPPISRSTQQPRQEDIRAKQVYEEVLSGKMSTLPSHVVMNQLKAKYGFLTYPDFKNHNPSIIRLHSR